MLTFLQLTWTTILQMVARVFGWWSRARLGVQLGPGLGLVTQRLSDLDFSRAVPAENPPSELLSEEARRQAYDSGPSEELRRANAWAGALERQIRDKPKPRGTVLTTYGFVWLSGRVQLSVIHYLQPMAAFLATPPQPITINEWPFPVVIRPWLAIDHSSGQGLDGNCWVTFPDGKGNRHFGVLTARHAVYAIRPRRSPWAIGGEVGVKVARAVPRGRLRHESQIMDAAVIEVGHSKWGQKVPVSHSSVVGYKPVRLVSSYGMVDGDVVEHSGFVAGTIFAEPNKEPGEPARLFMNKWLKPGESGCLVLDLEFARFGQILPYLMYLGKANFSRGGYAGRALLLEQAHRVWGLEFFQNEVSVATKDASKSKQNQVVDVPADAGIQRGGELVPIPAQSGMRITVADWVPEKANGRWGVTLAGQAPDKRVNWSSANDPLLLRHGQYDVYWQQDMWHDPMLLASGVTVQQNQVVGVPADAGIQIEVADWVPEKANGWWGVTLAGQAPDKRVNWSQANDPLLLPPGQYDVYWKQDMWHDPMLLASGIKLDDGQVAKVHASSGIQLKLAPNARDLDAYSGQWGVIASGGKFNELLNWVKGRSDQPLLVPPGTYDIIWQQDYTHKPESVQQDVTVKENALIELEVQPSAVPPPGER